MPTPNNNSLVLSYLDLRKAIGVIGLALPFVLVLGKIILQDPGIQVSISDYYYTVMRDVLVASLCAIGVFLFTYRGYERIDNISGKLAAIFAVGTALFPTTPKGDPSITQIHIGQAHIFFASALFIMMAFFCLALFRKTNPGKPPTEQKVKRNAVYTICGLGILACMVLAYSLKIFPADSRIFDFSPLFWLESLAVIFFGISWFVKGEAILKDEVVLD